MFRSKRSIRVMNIGLGFILFYFFLILFFLFSFYFIFIFIFIYIILNLDKMCNVISHMSVTHVTRCYGRVTLIIQSCDIEKDVKGSGIDDII